MSSFFFNCLLIEQINCRTVGDLASIVCACQERRPSRAIGNCLCYCHQAGKGTFCTWPCSTFAPLSLNTCVAVTSAKLLIEIKSVTFSCNCATCTPDAPYLPGVQLLGSLLDLLQLPCATSPSWPHLRHSVLGEWHWAQAARQ